MLKVSVGTPVVIVDVNRLDDRKEVVTKVGRQYFTVAGRQYKLANGRIHDAYGHATAYTIEDYCFYRHKGDLRYKLQSLVQRLSCENTGKEDWVKAQRELISCVSAPIPTKLP